MFAWSNPSNVNLAIHSPGHKNAGLRVLCRRVALDLLRTIKADVVSDSAGVPLTINPLWISPASQASKFPLVVVTLEHDMAKSGFQLMRSSSLLAQDTSRKLMSYIFSNGAGKFLGIKLQLDDGLRGLVRPHLEIMVSGETALEDWTTELIAVPVDQVVMTISDMEKWVLRADVRHKIKDNRRGQILSLILRISFECVDQSDVHEGVECLVITSY